MRLAANEFGVLYTIMLIESFQIEFGELPTVKLSTILKSGFGRHPNMWFNHFDKSWVFNGFYLHDDEYYYWADIRRDIISNIEMWHNIQNKSEFRKDHWVDSPWSFLNPHDKSLEKNLYKLTRNDVMQNGYIVFCCSDKGFTHIHSDYNESGERAAARIALMKNAKKTVAIKMSVMLDIYRATSRYFWDKHNENKRSSAYDYGKVEFELNIITQEWKRVDNEKV